MHKECEYDSFLVKTVAVFFLLCLYALAGAITFPAAAVFIGGTGAGPTGLLLCIGTIFLYSFVGHYIGRGIKAIKRPAEALIFTFVGAFFMGAIPIIFTIWNIPGTFRINLHWLGTSWYCSPLTFIFIGAPFMLVFVAVE